MKVFVCLLVYPKQMPLFVMHSLLPGTKDRQYSSYLFHWNRFLKSITSSSSYVFKAYHGFVKIMKNLPSEIIPLSYEYFRTQRDYESKNYISY